MKRNEVSIEGYLIRCVMAIAFTVIYLNTMRHWHPVQAHPVAASPVAAAPVQAVQAVDPALNPVPGTPGMHWQRGKLVPDQPAR